MNPFPLDRSRRGGRAHAHHNPMETLPHRAVRPLPAAGAGPGARGRSPTRFSTRSSPAWARTGTGRSSPFTSRPGRGPPSCCRPPREVVDPGRQLVSVVRKGSRQAQELPGLGRRLRVAAPLPGRGRGARAKRTPPAAVVDAAPSVPPAQLPSGAPHVRAGQPSWRAPRRRCTPSATRPPTAWPRTPGCP